MIQFYNKNREVVMVLHDFLIDNESETKLSFFVDISFSFYKASREIKDYKVYFDKFLEELKMLYEDKIKTAQFIPIQRELEIYFEKMNFGYILATIKMNYFNLDEVMLQSTLSIQYNIDQSFLPELIDEINAVINND